MDLLSELIELVGRTIEVECRNFRQGFSGMIEEEGRVLRRGLMRLLIGLVLLSLACLGLLVALLLVVFGLYVLFVPLTGHAGAAFIVAGILILLGINLLIAAKAWAR